MARASNAMLYEDLSRGIIIEERFNEMIFPNLPLGQPRTRIDETLTISGIRANATTLGTQRDGPPTSS